MLRSIFASETQDEGKGQKIHFDLGLYEYLPCQVHTLKKLDQCKYFVIILILIIMRRCSLVHFALNNSPTQANICLK